MTSRRRLLVGLGGALAAAAGLGRCGSRGMSPDEIRRRAAAVDRSFDCTDTRGLWPAEAQTRIDNEYRDRSDQELQFCFNCANFEPPAAAGACGSCRTVKGPIHPGGWCKSWTEKVS